MMIQPYAKQTKAQSNSLKSLERHSIGIQSVAEWIWNLQFFENFLHFGSLRYIFVQIVKVLKLKFFVFKRIIFAGWQPRHI